MRNTRSENKAGRRRQWSEEEAEGMVGRYVKSGLTQRVFAREMGIGVSTLQYWMRRKERRQEQRARRETDGGRSSPKVSLLEIDLASMAGGGRSAEERYEIEWANGTRLRVPRGFARVELQALVAVVQERA